MEKIDLEKQLKSFYGPSADEPLKNTLIALLATMGLAVLAVALKYTFWGPDISPILKTIFFVLLGGDAVCYFVAAWGVRRGVKWTYLFTIVLIAINILGIIFDDIGVVDIVFAITNIFILIVFINIRKKPRSGAAGR